MSSYGTGSLMDVCVCENARDECNRFPRERVDFSVSVRLGTVHAAPSVDGSDLGWREAARRFLRRPTSSGRKKNITSLRCEEWKNR